MANIVRRSDQRGMGMMPDPLAPWDLFREMARGAAMSGGAFIPSFDVKETRDAYIFNADLPGVEEDDIDVSLTGNQLTVSGQREQETHDEGDQYHTYERSYGSFTRSFSLPEGADPLNASADFENGVLRIVIGKRPGVQPRRISLLDRAKEVAREAKDKIVEVAESAKEKTIDKAMDKTSDKNKPGK